MSKNLSEKSILELIKAHINKYEVINTDETRLELMTYMQLFVTKQQIEKEGIEKVLLNIENNSKIKEAIKNATKN